MFVVTFHRARWSPYVRAHSNRWKVAPVSGDVIDKSNDVGALVSGRRYLETVVAEAGDVDITKYNVLVSIGRGIQEKDNVAIAAGTG